MWQMLVEDISFRISPLMAPCPPIISSYVPFIDTPTDRLTGGHDAARYKVEHLECVQFVPMQIYFVQDKV